MQVKLTIWFKLHFDYYLSPFLSVGYSFENTGSFPSCAQAGQEYLVYLIKSLSVMLQHVKWNCHPSYHYRE